MYKFSDKISMLKQNIGLGYLLCESRNRNDTHTFATSHNKTQVKQRAMSCNSQNHIDDH